MDQDESELRRQARIQAEEVLKAQEEAEKAKWEQERKEAPKGCLSLIIAMVFLALLRWLLRLLGVTD